jgi:hypothetical protein
MIEVVGFQEKWALLAEKWWISPKAVAIALTPISEIVRSGHICVFVVKLGTEVLLRNWSWERRFCSTFYFGSMLVMLSTSTLPTAKMSKKSDTVIWHLIQT